MCDEAFLFKWAVEKNLSIALWVFETLLNWWDVKEVEFHKGKQWRKWGVGNLKLLGFSKRNVIDTFHWWFHEGDIHSTVISPFQSSVQPTKKSRKRHREHFRFQPGGYSPRIRISWPTNLPQWWHIKRAINFTTCTISRCLFPLHYLFLAMNIWKQIRCLHMRLRKEEDHIKYVGSKHVTELVLPIVIIKNKKIIIISGFL